MDLDWGTGQPVQAAALAMGLFTQLSAADIGEIAARFGLGEVEEASNIPAGTINSNYRLIAGGTTWFVRVNEGKDEDAVAYEAELVVYLAERNVPTPRAVPADDGRRFASVAAGLVTVFPWVSGSHRRSRALGPKDCASCGAALAALHHAGRGFGSRRPNRYELPRVAQRLRNMSGADDDPVLAEALADVGEELAWLAGCSGHRASLPTGVIHGDLFPDNVLFEGDRLAALLDFEQASDGAWVYDLAVCLNAWCYGDDFDPERARALREGYERLRPLGRAERDGLWVEARAAAVRFTITRITDVALNPAATAVVRASKDFRRFHSRLLRLRALGPDGFAALVGA